MIIIVDVSKFLHENNTDRILSHVEAVVCIVRMFVCDLHPCWWDPVDCGLPYMGQQHVVLRCTSYHNWHLENDHSTAYTRQGRLWDRTCIQTAHDDHRISSYYLTSWRRGTYTRFLCNFVVLSLYAIYHVHSSISTVFDLHCGCGQWYYYIVWPTMWDKMLTIH